MDKSDTEAKEEKLRQELAHVRRVNEAIEETLQHFNKAKENMKTINNTVGSASSLLNIWTRILSQTEHNQRLILDPSWQGASQDIADVEEELVAQQQAAERQAQEEEERRAAAARKAEEEERRRAEAALKTPRGTSKGRVRGRGISRASSIPATSGIGSSSANTSILGRGTTGTRRAANGSTRGMYGRVTRGRP